ncbi:MAG: transcriptional regulator [Candidatus Poribacteria bacterium]|nr:MAG: transcriptional regulator [Candidatus Poribacteria bacterium]
MAVAASVEIDAVDGKLLNRMQEAFPLTERPFRVLGEMVGISEEEALRRTIRLRRAQIIRQISAIFDTRALGYKSSLVAFKVAPAELIETARIVNRHPGVSHNYERNHEYNLWFTIAVPPGHEPEEDVAILARESGAVYRMLPTLVLYKIGVKLDVAGEAPPTATSEDKGFRRPVREEPPPLSEFDKEFVRAMQEQIELVEEPFRRPAERLGVSQSRLFQIAEEFQQTKRMRRFAAILRHQRAGFRANAMAVWAVPPERADEIGERMAAYRAVSHCYRRPTYPDWPYSIFTMIHGRSREECEAVARAIEEETGIHEYRMLYSLREFKKVRLQYFTEDYGRWCAKYKSGTALSEGFPAKILR